jgi:hypothetical protein
VLGVRAAAEMVLGLLAVAEVQAVIETLLHKL